MIATIDMLEIESSQRVDRQFLALYYREKIKKRIYSMYMYFESYISLLARKKKLRKYRLML